MTLFEDLEWRGLVKDITSEELKEKLNAGELTFYIGVDPTDDSMHIGHYSSFLICKRLAKAGNNPILLMGGGTGLIGDPKPSSERQMISYEAVAKNIKGLTKQAEEIFGFTVVNNYDWLKDINMIDYLRDYGKYFPINYMLSKDIISRRLESGITYTEFSYMLLQSIDFLHLYNSHNCTLQVAGSDQWGNITAGVELIRKKEEGIAYGMVMPLITDSRGMKIGKTDGNALWLDKDKTPVYDMYQYFFNLDDITAVDLLKKLTFMPRQEIEKVEKEHFEAPEKRIAQKNLAREIITDLHGSDEYIAAEKKAFEIFNSRGQNENTPQFEIEGSGDFNIVDMLFAADLFPSKSEARRMIEQGAISINNEKETDPSKLITADLLKEGILVQKGKKTFLKIKYKN